MHHFLTFLVFKSLPFPYLFNYFLDLLSYVGVVLLMQVGCSLEEKHHNSNFEITNLLTSKLKVFV